MATRRDGSPKGKTAATSTAPPTNKLSTRDVRKQPIVAPPIKKPTTTARKTPDKAPAKPSLHSHETTPHLPTRKTPPPITSRLKTPSPSRKTQAPIQSHVKTTTPAPRKPSPSLTSHDKTPVPARKTQAPSLGKSIASQKMALGKKLKALLHTPASKASNEVPAPKTEQPTFQENDDNLNIYQNLPEVESSETLLEDQELVTFFQQQDIQTAADNIEPEDHDQEKPLAIEEAEKVVIPVEPSPVPVDVRTEELEEKLFVEEKPEVGSEYHSEEDDEKKVEVVEKGEDADHSEAHEDEDEKKDEVIEKVEVADLSEVHVSEETKEPEVVAEKKTQKVEKQGFAVRKGSVVSNSAIEETATKLREQRISRVRALAGAFESVMH